MNMGAAWWDPRHHGCFLYSMRTCENQVQFVTNMLWNHCLFMRVGSLGSQQTWLRGPLKVILIISCWSYWNYYARIKHQIKINIASNFASKVMEFCDIWEGQALPHVTKFHNCGGKIIDNRAIPSWSSGLVHVWCWSILIKLEPDYHILTRQVKGMGVM